MKKDNYIQIRITDQLKKDFKTILKSEKLSMSEVLTYAITNAVDDMQSPYTHKCISGERTSIPNDFYAITDFVDSPELKQLLIEYEYGMNDEHACISDECLIELYNQLLATNQLHMLFEWVAFNNNIKNEWSGDA